MVYRLVSGNGPEYSSNEFQDFSTKYEFAHVTSSPGYPQSDRKAESAVKNVKWIMEKALDAKRNTPSAGIRTSPAKRMFGRRVRTTIPTSRQILEPTCMCSAQHKLQQARTRQAHYYNKESKQLSRLKLGDAVRMLPKKGRKLWRKEKVKAIVIPRSYIVTTDDGGNYRRNRRYLRKSLESDAGEADIELPTDLPDPLPQPGRKEPVLQLEHSRIS